MIEQGGVSSTASASRDKALKIAAGTHGRGAGRQAQVRAHHGHMTYEVYAHQVRAPCARAQAENFIGGDPHDGPMPMDYFVWLIRGDGRAIVSIPASPPRWPRSASATHPALPDESLALLGVRCGAGAATSSSRTCTTTTSATSTCSRTRASTCRSARWRYATGQYMRYPRIAPQLRRRGRGRHGARASTRARALPRRRRRDRAGHLAASHRRPHDGPAGRARADAARLAGARLRREPLLRQHGADAGRSRSSGRSATWSTATQAARARAIRPRTSSPATTRW